MCGRYTLAAPAGDLVEAFDVPVPVFELRPRYNIAPGQQAPVVAADRRGRRMGMLEWGLVPPWADEPGSGSINARAETVAEKPTFREAFERRRCLIPADGFYEWQRDPAGKTPFWFHPPGGGLLAFAGIWATWSRPGREPRHTFAILTTNASAEVAPIHDRMPVLIDAPDREVWLDRSARSRDLVRLLHPAPDGSLVAQRVSTRVNGTAVDDAGLLDPV